MERLFLLTSSLLARTVGPLWLLVGGGGSLMADSWPSDKASSLQALTGNGTRAGALRRTARSESGRSMPPAGCVCTGADLGRLAVDPGLSSTSCHPMSSLRSAVKENY